MHDKILHSDDITPFCTVFPGKRKATLRDVLIFFSGADSIPAGGTFDVLPTISFNHEHFYPRSSICTLHVTLPGRNRTYELFADKMEQAVLDHGGFGLP